MRILVTGGAGFIGSNICRVALLSGHSVIAFDNLVRHGVKNNIEIFRKEKRYQFIAGDIRNKSNFDQFNNIDCIINLAANPSVPRSITDPLYDFSINVVGHLNILEFAKSHGKIPVILASTNKVYTDQMNQLPLVIRNSRYEYTDPNLNKYGFNEHTDVDGVEGFTNSPYGTAKLAAEKYSREYWHHYGVQIVINRMSCVYGEFQKGVEEQGWVDWFLRAKYAGIPLNIYGDGKQVRDLLFGADVASLYLWQAEHIDRVNGMTFNIGGGPAKGFQVSLLELINYIDEHFSGKKLQYRFEPWRPSDQRIYISDIRKVKHTTGWVPTTSIAQGLSIMWKAFNQYGF